MSKRTVINVGKYLLAIGLLVWVIQRNWAPTDSKGLGYVWQTHIVEGKPIHTGFLLVAVATFLASALLTFFRWYLLVRAVDLPFRLVDALRLGLVGLFFNAFLPGSVGGDIIKAAVLAREQSRRTVAVATVIMDRAIALWALVWFVALMGSFFWLTGQLEDSVAERSKGVVLGAITLVAISVAVWLLLGRLPSWRAERFAGRLEHLPRIGGSAAEFWRAVWMYRCRQGSVALVLGLSWIGHVGFVFAFWCSANVLWSPELGPIPPLAEHFLLVPMGLVVQALVPTPGGAGGGEWGFGGLYQLFGGEAVNGVLGSLVQRVIGWVLGLIGYLVYLRMRATLPTALTRQAMPQGETKHAATLNGEVHPRPASESFTAH
ncbi:MAG TPA: lysylphosphatidylglycerol synthase transmembrane domain-containing protein [Gemmataceae bacterium]|nr:lysylphosphatidylglycerol synthase transmembrane domain-containing protein [Gemmataceae bacterium]